MHFRLMFSEDLTGIKAGWHAPTLIEWLRSQHAIRFYLTSIWVFNALTWTVKWVVDGKLPWQ